MITSASTMARLLRKVASRIRGSKPQPDIATSPEKSSISNNLSLLMKGKKPSTAEAPLFLHQDDIHGKDKKKKPQSMLRLWSTKLRMVARRNRISRCHWEQSISGMPAERLTPTKLLSPSASSCTDNSYPSSISHNLKINHGNRAAVQPSFSVSTAEIDAEFGFSIQRMQRISGQHVPHLYLDVSRQSNNFSPFRPFSPSVLATSSGHNLPAADSLPFHYIHTTSSFDRYINPSDPVSRSARNRFYSQTNLGALGVNCAPTADSRVSTGTSGILSPTARKCGLRAPSSTSYNSPRSLSGSGRLSPSVVSTRQNSVRSLTTSPNTTPSSPLASPTSFF